MSEGATTLSTSPARPAVLHVPHLDAPLYRIFPLWFFEQALQLRQLVLIAPQLWEDPYEDMASKVMMHDPQSRPCKQKSLSHYLKPAYAQCWSQVQESDTLLRAYSRVHKDPQHQRNTDPHNEGVRVRSSARKILTAIDQWAQIQPGVSIFWGAVQYASHEAIGKIFANTISQYGPREVGSGTLRANLLLLKRMAFAHESEVRFICVDDRPGSKQQPTLAIPVNPSEIFDGVLFDPRLAPFERLERIEVIQRLGYTGTIEQSLLYQQTFFEIPVPGGWPEE